MTASLTVEKLDAASVLVARRVPGHLAVSAEVDAERTCLHLMHATVAAGHAVAESMGLERLSDTLAEGGEGRRVCHWWSDSGSSRHGVVLLVTTRSRSAVTVVRDLGHKLTVTPVPAGERS